MNIRPVEGGGGASSLQTDVQIDITKLIVAFDYFANAPNEIEQKWWYSLHDLPG
jgi:hypothetical protein